MERSKYVAKSGHAVFLIEDDAALQRLYKKGLDRYGHDVYVFGDAEEFVSFMRTANLPYATPEGKTIKYVIVSDFNLPGKNGADAMAEVAALELPIDLSTIGTSANTDNLYHFKQKGADAVVDKAALSMDSLDHMVRSLVARKAA
jgi:CheY-like chemotaxis protein